MTALLYLIQIYRVVDRFKGCGFRVQGCGSGFAANSNGALVNDALETLPLSAISPA